MVLVIDNYDSFTYNLVRYIQLLGIAVRVIRHDEMTLTQLAQLSFSHILLSPGPGNPNDAGICLEVIDYFKERTPIFGVCLGLQCLVQAFGGKIIHAPTIMHGKSTLIFHQQQGVFENLPSPFRGGRYHSLVADPLHVPDCLEITAWTTPANETSMIMGLRHRKFLIEAVQFHPESVLTEHGLNLLANFFRDARGKSK